MSAAEIYAARVDAVVHRPAIPRTRGPQPPGDLFAPGLADSALRDGPAPTLRPNLEIIASYVEPGDVILDVGGGGRAVQPATRAALSRGRQPRPVGGHARRVRGQREPGGIENVRVIEADWLDASARPAATWCWSIT